MYKAASRNFQRRAEQRGVLQLDGGAETLTPLEEWETLRVAVKGLEAALVNVTNKDERKRLGMKKLEIQTRIKELRAIVSYSRETGKGMYDFIGDAAKEIVSSAVWKIIVKRATELYEEHKKSLAQKDEPA